VPVTTSRSSLFGADAGLPAGQPVRGLLGVYADTTTADSRSLGRVHELLTREPIRLDGDCLLVQTCQRVEVYWAGEAPDLVSLQRTVDLSGRVETDAVLPRLTEIATGLRSELVGERFIHEQLRRARLHLEPDSAVGAAADHALYFAEALRRRHDFRARVDYPDLTFDLLDAQPHSAPILVIVGSGLLAQAVTAHSRVAGYERVLMVTRSPKRLRKRGRGTIGAASAFTVPRALQELKNRDWDVVIATSNLTAQHRAAVTRLLSSPGRRTVVDLGSVPVVAEPLDDRHFTLYHDSFVRLVGGQNAAVAEAAARVRGDLAALLGGVQ
jgi:glutamyl-tRNA reductase